MDTYDSIENLLIVYRRGGFTDKYGVHGRAGYKLCSTSHPFEHHGDHIILIP